MTRPAVQRRVNSGALHVVYPRTYSVGHGHLTTHARWMSAVLAAGSGAVLTHDSAAALLGIWSRRVYRTWIAAPAHSTLLARRGIVVRRSQINEVEITKVRGIPVTTVPRTLIDLCACFTAQQIAAVIREAEFHGTFTRVAVDHAIARARDRRSPHLQRLVDALEIREHGGAGTRSGLEDRVLAALQRSKIALPQVNVHVSVAGMSLEVDLVWRHERLCVEIDGPGHERPAERRADGERDRLLRAAGYEVLRFTDHDIRSRPGELADVIRAALCRATREL